MEKLYQKRNSNLIELKLLRKEIELLEIKLYHIQNTFLLNKKNIHNSLNRRNLTPENAYLKTVSNSDINKKKAN